VKIGDPLAGDYGPRFVGYGEVPAAPLWRRAMPWLCGAAVTAAAFVIEALRAA
jgi:hypothetical protein